MENITKSIICIISLSTGAASFAQGSHGSHGGSTPPTSETPSADSFSTSVVGLPEAASLSEVRLNDGSSYTLEARAVKQKIGSQWIRRLAYNGALPGPILRVQQGSKVSVTLKNSTEVPTTLHPHGLRLSADFDGVPGVSQPAIDPGQSYIYELSFPDAGIYWYHPHVREDYAQDAGLYGVFIVEPKNTTDYNSVHREIPLVLDDVLIDPKAQFKKDSVTHTLMGRFGNVNLVNGLVLPSFSVTKGEVVRFFVLNSSNTRVYAFAIPNTKVKRVGGDNGLYEKEEWASKIVLGPGERSIVEVKFDKVGKFAIRNDKPTSPVTLAEINVREGIASALPGNFNTLRINPAASAEIAKIKPLLKSAIAKKLTLTLDMDHAALPMDHSGMNGMDHSGMNGMNHSGMDHSAMAVSDSTAGIEWDDEMPEMNEASNNSNVLWKLVDDATGKANMDINWIFKKGQYSKIRIFNDPNSMHPMQHPIHFHGQRFLVAAVNGKAPANLVWKDTVLVPTGATVDILLEASNPGEWMAHCHISEHLEANMMLGFSVVE